MTYTAKAREIRRQLTNALTHLTDDERLSVIALHRKWEVGEHFTLGEVVHDEGHLWRCEQPSLIGTPEWRPSEDLPALWTKLQPEQVGGGIIEWFEPTATNNYKLGDLVRYTDGLVYESGMDNNTTNPLTHPNPPYPTGWVRRPDLD